MPVLNLDKRFAQLVCSASYNEMILMIANNSARSNTRGGGKKRVRSALKL
jgi:hypothetical protein